MLQLRLRQAATAPAAVAAPADPAQAPAAVAAPAHPALAPAHCQVANGERVLSESELQQGLADGVAAMRARRANLEGALARPGALQQRQIAAPQFVACALAVQMTDVVLQTNQEVQASTQAAGITVCGYLKLLHRALKTTSPSSSGLMQVMLMLGLKQHSCLKAV